MKILKNTLGYFMLIGGMSRAFPDVNMAWQQVFWLLTACIGTVILFSDEIKRGKMKVYTYATPEYNLPLDQNEMNKWAVDGWEVVAVIQLVQGVKCQLILKRETPTK